MKTSQLTGNEQICRVQKNKVRQNIKVPLTKINVSIQNSFFSIPFFILKKHLQS